MAESVIAHQTRRATQTPWSVTEALAFITATHARIETLSGSCAHIRTHSDWLLLREIWSNWQQGISTMASDVHKAIDTERSVSSRTVRARLTVLEEGGWLEVGQKAGRAVLYQPTPKMERAMEAWAKDLAQAIARRRAGC